MAHNNYRIYTSLIKSARGKIPNYQVIRDVLLHHEFIQFHKIALMISVIVV